MILQAGGLGPLQDIYLILNTPGGLLILFIGIGILGYKGVWIWGREGKVKDEHIKYLRGLVERGISASATAARTNSKAVEIIKQKVSSDVLEEAGEAVDEVA